MENVIKVKLEQILADRGMTIYKLAKNTSISYNNLHRLTKKKPKVISFDVLEKLCVVLQCTPNDLFEVNPATWVLPPKDKTGKQKLEPKNA